MNNPTATQPRIHRFANIDVLTDRLCGLLAQRARQCIQSGGRFDIALAGGATPRRLYQKLRNIDTDWPAWQIYFGDERCLARGHLERNDSMASQAWLDYVPIPRQQIHRILCQDAVDVTTAAAAYSTILALAPRFDLVLLGLGEDGHTASLFPECHSKNRGPDDAVPVTHAPKPPRCRVSISPRRLSDADAVWFMVCGETKRKALAAWLRGEDLPARWITPTHGVDIFTDLPIR